MTVALILTARPSYSRVRTLIQSLRADGVTVHLIVAGSAMLYRYGAVVDLIRRECGPVESCWTVLEGETLETTAKSTGLVLLELPGILRRLRPDAVIVHADRHEVLGAAIAARYLELPVIHLQGGEQTGSIDDRVRDAITQLADVHLVSTEAAQARVWAMRGHRALLTGCPVRGHRAILTGCPSIDVAREAAEAPPVTSIGGAGSEIDFAAPFVVVLQHPTSDTAGAAFLEMCCTLQACEAVGLPAVVLWPGNEAGAEATSKAIRLYHGRLPIRTVRNVPPVMFLRLLTQAACLVGNSSVGIRECAYLGVPAVNIGARQDRRERAGNVVDVPFTVAAIYDAVTAQVAHGRYPSSTLYGDGRGGERMAQAIKEYLRGIGH